jgi:hypothetical protein
MRLDVQDLEVKNRALLGKGIAKLLPKDRFWLTIPRRKYAASHAIYQFH